MIQHNNQATLQTPIIKNGTYVINYISSTTFGFVNNEEEARTINFNRGYVRGYFFDMNKGVFYFKEIDNLGQLVKFETYEYNLVIPPEPEKPVTHEDLANMQNNILAQIASMLQPKKEGDAVG